MRPYYTTEGNIRVTCGHKHRTEESARQCIEMDRDDCRAKGGYSDRFCWYVTGEWKYGEILTREAERREP